MFSVVVPLWFYVVKHGQCPWTNWATLIITQSTYHTLVTIGKSITASNGYVPGVTNALGKSTANTQPILHNYDTL